MAKTMESGLRWFVYVLAATGMLLHTSHTQNIHSDDAYCHTRTSIGRDFIFGIPRLRFFTGDARASFNINVASKNPGRVKLMFHRNQFNVYDVPAGGTHIQVPQDHLLPHLNATEHNGIWLSADMDISVSVLSRPNSSISSQGMDGYLVLPEPSLSTNYIVSSYDSFNLQWPVEILVIGTAPGTSVTIKTPETHTNPARQQTIKLNRLDSYILSGQTDLSGTLIASDKPVAVIAATDIATVPSNSQASAESIFDMIVPTEFSGYSYIVPRLPEKLLYAVKFFPTINNTNVLFRNKSIEYGAIMRTDVSNEFLFRTFPLFIHADKPILVYQYGSSKFHGDVYGAFMRNIPAMENYVSNVSFVVQSDVPDATNILQIVMPSNASLFLDDAPISSLTAITNDQVYVNGSYYDAISIELPKHSSLLNRTQYHTLYSKDTTVLFGAFVMGFIRNTQSAYGYPLVQTKVCRTNGTGSTQHLTTNTSGHGVLCLDCTDLEELYFCDVYRKCDTSQVCFVEKYQNHAAQYRYRTGCANSDQCASSNPPKRQTEVTQCVECCHGNFCNTNGCGAKGLPPRDVRGPMCLNCLHSSSVEACKTLSFCKTNEVCSIRVAKVFGSVRQYSMGCANKDCHTQEHKRSALLCAHCCGDDFCNNECRNSSVIEPAIIG